MERGIYDLFTPATLAAALQRFDLDTSPVVELGRGNNFVYRTACDGSPFVLHITHDRQKTASLLRGEVDWMSFVSGHGIATPQVITSPNGQTIESFDDGRGGQFHGVLYEFVDGERYRLLTLDHRMLEDWGTLTGQLHVMARNYPTTSNGPHHRGDDWHDEFLDPRRHLPADKHWVVGVYDRNREVIAQCTKSPQNYVMIHNDLHPGNFIRRSDGQPVLLDFDDAHVDHIESDLANILLTLLDLPTLYPMRNWPMDREQAFERFCKSFLPAYRRQADWSAVSVEALNAFILRRVMVLYIDWHRSRDVSTFAGPWRAIFEQFEQAIRNETDVLSPQQLAAIKKPAFTM